MEVGEGGVTLLHYGPSCQLPASRPLASTKSSRLLSKLRRRSRSQPRHRDPQPRPIVYTANGERIKSSEEVEPAAAGGVQLVGFSFGGEVEPPPPPLEHRRNSDISKTSAEIKETSQILLNTSKCLRENDSSLVYIQINFPIFRNIDNDYLLLCIPNIFLSGCFNRFQYVV